MIITPYRNNIFGGRGETKFSITKSFLLDGVDEYFNADAVYTNNSTDTVGTISILTKSIESTPTATGYIWGVGDTDADTYMNLTYRSDNKIQVSCVILGALKWIVRTTGTFDLTSWTKIDVVQDGVQPVIYINGVAEPQTNVVANDLTIWYSTLTNADNFRIGQLSKNSTLLYGFKGYISQVSYINTNISQAQITDWYNNGQPKNPQQLFGSNCKFFFNPDNSGSTAQFTVSDSVNSINATSVNLEDADKTTTTPY